MAKPKTVQESEIERSSMLSGRNNCVVRAALHWPKPGRADVMTPEPRTAWKKGQSPNESSVIIAGLALSAAVVVSGLLFARLSFSKSRVAAIAVVALASAAVVGVVFGARHYLGLIGEDREKWTQWEYTESKRPRGGRTPEIMRRSPPDESQDKK